MRSHPAEIRVGLSVGHVEMHRIPPEVEPLASMGKFDVFDFCVGGFVEDHVGAEFVIADLVVEFIEETVLDS